LNGHFENVYFLLEGADLAIRDLAPIGINNFQVIVLTYWDFIVGEELTEVFPDGFQGWAAEHGAVMETSADVASVSKTREHVFSAGEIADHFSPVRHPAACARSHAALGLPAVRRKSICRKGQAFA
jgi:hypothetical protein